MEREEFLQSQLALSERAKRAYESYLSALFDEYKTDILRDFMNATPHSESLITLKHRLDFVISFENKIKSDIQNGQMAAKELGIN